MSERNLSKLSTDRQSIINAALANYDKLQRESCEKAKREYKSPLEEMKKKAALGIIDGYARMTIVSALAAYTASNPDLVDTCRDIADFLCGDVELFDRALLAYIT